MIEKTKQIHQIPQFLEVDDLLQLKGHQHQFLEVVHLFDFNVFSLQQEK